MLARDLHPVEAYVPHINGAPFPARVFVTTHRVQVWADQGGTPAVVYEANLTEPVERNRGTLTGQLHVRTPDGDVYVSRGTGCGCGSVLKALSPPVGWQG